MTLYKLTSEYECLLAMLEDPDMDDQVIADTLEGLSGEIEIKADGYARVIKQMDADSKAIKAEEERLYNRRKSLENRISYLKNRLQYAMELIGFTKIKTELFNIGIQKNPAKVVIDDPKKVPAEYLIPQDPKIDTAALKEALKDSDESPFLQGIAHLEQSESLRIR